MKRLRLWRFGFIVLIILATQLAFAQQPVFRIGVLEGASGSITRGAQMAVEEINNAGGVRGADGTFFRLELIVQSTNGGANLDTAVANINQANTIAVLGPQTNSEALGGLGQLQGLNVPVLTPATNDSILLTDTTDRLFRSRAAQILQGQALALYLVNDQNLRSIAVVQLDVESTDNVVGFSSSLQALGVSPQTLLLQSRVTDLVTTLVQSNPQVAVVYGDGQLASELFTLLRQSGWAGRLAYDQANSPDFAPLVPVTLRSGLLSTTSWPYTATDASSDQFLAGYVRMFGLIPDAIAAASYDSVKLLAAAIGQPGDLQTNLRSLDNVQGVQGMLRPAQLSAGETSNNVAVIRINEYGVPQVAARYAGGVKVEGGQLPPSTFATATAVPTATPDGVVATVTGRPFQNVRSGPSIQFEVLGQLNEGETVRVLGASRGNTWVVIDFRGRQGWMSAGIMDIFGDLNTVPIVDSPPTPTPASTATPAPPQEADIVIESASVSPSPIIVGQNFSTNVVVRNRGNSNAGHFAIAATFPPNNVYTAADIPGLAAGQAVTTTLNGTLSNTGFYTVIIVADLNNEVAEGPGEGNNSAFTLSYGVDKPIIRQTTAALNPGDTLDLEGNGVQGDVNWNGSGSGAKLDALFGAKLGIIPNVTLETVHWDLINVGIINQSTISRTSMNQNTIIGVITADGNRGVLRVDNIPGDQLQVTLRVYQN
ncbi:MAG: ABC transporter substrate-binding protein [Anaerolineae bacterium]|nr:ABC transporter substrate-binding protein [Anaerolineae bacterium]